MNALTRCAAGIGLGLWAGWFSTAALAAEPVSTSAATASTAAAAGSVTGQAATTTTPTQDTKTTQQKTSTKTPSKPAKTDTRKTPVKPAATLDSSSSSFLPTPDNNSLWRSHVNFGTVAKVDPFTGQLHAYIPLIRIPENDGLTLRVGLTLMTGNTGDQNFVPYTGFLASSDNFNYSTAPIIFLDPRGHRHTFYFASQNGNIFTFYSRDHWSATLWADGESAYWDGAVASPNGVHYTISNDAVWQINSKNNGTVIYYHYDVETGDSGDGLLLTLQSITVNNGLSISFAGQVGNNAWGTGSISWSFPNSMTLNNSTWQFNVSPPQWRSLEHLESVTLPDGRSWQFQWQWVTPPQNSGVQFPMDALQQITYPSGLTNQFSLSINQAPIAPGGSGPWYGWYAVSQEVDSGPNLPATTTTFQYSGDNPRTTTITNPYRTTIITYIDNPLIGTSPFNGASYAWGQFSQNSGLIQSKVIDAPNGTALQSTTYTWYQDPTPLIANSNVTLCNYTDRNGNPGIEPCAGQGGNESVIMYLPQTITTTRDGTTYTTTYSNYDSYYFPQTITQTGQDNTLTTQYTYYENPSKWIFQPQNATTTDGSGNVVNTVIRNFDGNGNLTSKTVNGVTTQFTYDNAGDLRSVTNALNQTSSFGNYVAGKPETIVDALGHITVFTILPDGTITRYIDPLGNTYYFSYDNMFRLTQIQFPKGDPINITWNTAGQNTEQITRDDFQKTIFNDAKAQPIETIDKDTNTGAQRIVYQNYDGLGRSVFTSYPQGQPNSEPLGIATSYDALGRVTSVSTGSIQSVQEG